MPAHTSDLQTPSAYEQEEESTESEEDSQRDEVPHSVKVTRVIDDGTQSFFWRTHSVTVLICMLAVFLYVALIEEPKNDINYNTKRGILACIVAFCLFGMTQAKDGPFTRPHPAFWRLVLCLSVVYELALVYMLFQSLDDARQLMKHFDPELGEPLPERSYAEDCRFYDPEPHQDGHFHNFWEKCDVFIWGHLFGWWAKMLMVRDYWLCNVISILFEVLEYTLEHQLPNFAECWWDHWLLDAVICNGLGIWLGMKTLNYLNASTYHWRGLWSINTYSGKLKRMMMQFTPYSWTEFEWHPTESLNRWIFVILLVCFFLVAELNCFYLKFVLWIPPPHYVNFTRLVLLVPVGAVAIREAYQYLNDPADGSSHVRYRLLDHFLPDTPDLDNLVLFRETLSEIQKEADDASQSGASPDIFQQDIQKYILQADKNNEPRRSHETGDDHKKIRPTTDDDKRQIFNQIKEQTLER
ncbi:putative phosphatidylserine synthase 2-like [Apostichopus japonicus]|uniref:Phosphatidylserine synthase n=1 Tax=Stichopus japonicus TaxID=307972 RepID=A0A2G8L816_STIJA|nr:putative phosphatidylserine synthase 2-like [Apostichopus japonicus]